MGDLAVKKARDEVVRQIEGLGYRRVRRKGDDFVFRGPAGKVTFRDDGVLAFGKTLVRFVAPPPAHGMPDVRRAIPGEMTPMEGGAGPWVQLGTSRTKMDPVREEVLAATRDAVDAYLAVVRRTAFEEALQRLPDRLDRLWQEGVPLSGDDPLPTPDARRRAVLEHWATRTETPEGTRAAAAVEAWLRAVVQPSDHPITEAERAEFGPRRSDGRELPL